MKSARIRLTLWFSLGALGASLLTAGVTYWRLSGFITKAKVDLGDSGDSESQSGTGLESPGDPNHGLAAEALGLFFVLSLVSVGAGAAFARRFLRPIALLNERLSRMDVSGQRLDMSVPSTDGDFKELTRHVREIVGRLNRSLEDTKESAASIAHELRTPLQIIRLKLESSQGKIDPGLSEELQEEVDRLRHVVEQVLLIAKAERGRLTLQNSRFDLVAITRDVIIDFRLLAEDRGRKLSLLHAREFEPFIQADRKYYRQILHALLANALTHGTGEIRVRIRVHNQEARLFIGNRVGLGEGPHDLTLGLGLRVVKALLSTMPGTKFRRYRGATYYGVFLKFPMVEPPTPSTPSGSPPSTATSSSFPASIKRSTSQTTMA